METLWMAVAFVMTALASFFAVMWVCAWQDKHELRERLAVAEKRARFLERVHHGGGLSERAG